MNYSFQTIAIEAPPCRKITKPGYLLHECSDVPSKIILSN